MALNGYYNRFNSEKKYIKALFVAGQGLQSAELNEIQDFNLEALKKIGNALFADGDVISGCTCVIDQETGLTKVEGGSVYLNGLIRDVRDGEFTIPVDTSVRIGIYYREKTITSLEDASLRNPALGTRGYQEDGAARLQYLTEWGYQVPGSQDDEEKGKFYTIYNVENGVLVQKAPAPQLEAVNSALARYDNESNGSYVVNGMKVTCVSATEMEQVFSVGEGKAHVSGYEIELPHALRSVFDTEIDFQLTTSDPYVFEPGSDGSMTIRLNYTPLAEVKSVDITAEKTINLSHGSYSGCLDPIPNQSVLQIIEIKQGATIYKEGSDYKLTQGQVDWSPLGDEPAPGSNYTITYQYRTQIEPTDVTDTGFKISGAVSGTLVLVTYTWKMPRYDVLTIDGDGIVRKIKGLAHPWSPSVPKVPSGQLSLATILQTWETGKKPNVENNAIRAVLMADLENMQNQIQNLYYLIAQEQLKNDANASDPAAKKGIFVDPFFDDDMRDQGETQTAAIVDQKLVLPIDTDITEHARDQEVYLLPYELEAVVTQEQRTGWMKVNPYNAFDPIPADLKLNLNVDSWTEYDTQWLSPQTNYYYYYRTFYYSSYSYTQSLGTTTRSQPYMRSIKQKFSIDGFRSGERLEKFVFNGVSITATEA